MDQLRKKILVTGANGFLGQKIIESLVADPRVALYATSQGANRNFIQEGYTFVQCALEDEQALGEMLSDIAPDAIIHTAAISSVENCENDPQRCQAVNVDSVRHIGQYCMQHRTHLVFLSTDFVFDGQHGPYAEDDALGATNAYGASKIEAEAALTAIGCSAAILRTILVYGVHGDGGRSNLVLWAKSQLEQHKDIQVVDDQWRMPTFVDDLAQACIQASHSAATGIFHVSGAELMTILEAVQQVAQFWQLDSSHIHPISAAAIGQHKNRPPRTGFILTKAQQNLGYTPTPFVVSLQKIDEQLKFYNR